jgi:hypothetical protein
MNWMLVSIAALLIAISGPLLMVESTPQVRTLAGLYRRRQLLRLWTVAALLAACAYLVSDRQAISLGSRSIVVAGLAAALFFALLLSLGLPILHEAARATPASRDIPSPGVLGGPWDVPVLVALATSLAGFAFAANDLGYRTKGLAIILAGGAVYFMGRPRAPRTFVLCAAVGAFTLFAQWYVPWQRTLGVVAQLSVGVVGLVWCARLLVRSTAEASEAGDRITMQ